MRLWHESLIPYLPRLQLLGQWRECIALLGNGWGKKHRTVNYVFEHSDKKLLRYAKIVAEEMIKRGYSPNIDRVIYALCKRYDFGEDRAQGLLQEMGQEEPYPEHNEDYLCECLNNLRKKGIVINIKNKNI